MAYETKCWINSSWYKPYVLSQNISWLNPNSPEYNPYWHWLSTVCFLEGNDYWIRRPGVQDSWSVVSRAQVAISEVMNYYSPLVTFRGQQLVLQQDEVSKYVKQAILKYDGTMLLPFGTDYFIFDGELQRNIWADTRLRGDPNNIYNAVPILDIIYTSLCNQGPLPEWDKLIEEINSCQTQFSWVWHFISNIVCCPGRKPQTTLWFLGSYGGGKGTLVETLSRVLGNSYYLTELKSGEVERGWTSNLKNKLLVHANEFDAGDKNDTYNFIKEHASDLRIDLQVRGKEQFPTINMSQWIFSTNNTDSPILIKEGDRRHTLVESRDMSDNYRENQRWVRQRARMALEETDPSFDPRTLDGFAALVEATDPDYDFISEPFETGIRQHIIGWNLTGLDKVIMEIRTQQGSTAGEQLLEWWRTTQREVGDPDHLKRADFIEAIKRETGAAPKNIKLQLKKAGFDLDEIFVKQRVGGTVTHAVKANPSSKKDNIVRLKQMGVKVPKKMEKGD